MQKECFSSAQQMVFWFHSPASQKQWFEFTNRKLNDFLKLNFYDHLKIQIYILHPDKRSSIHWSEKRDFNKENLL